MITYEKLQKKPQKGGFIYELLAWPKEYQVGLSILSYTEIFSLRWESIYL
jgi:hypothetical protein